ncbi:hypothetical protein HC766_01655 [Candidatus Gracilibacteria bacterium]|nr:hypothetical protein [Candidatus Gracilibacteria bacterium]
MFEKSRRGLNLIYLTVVITLIIWLGSKFYYGDYFLEWQKYPAKASSLSAIILICWTVILSTRIRVIEKLFGGLDKVYKAHRKIGKFEFFVNSFTSTIFSG